MAKKSCKPDRSIVSGLLIMALAEDIGCGDITSNSVIPEDALFSGFFISRQKGIVCGMDILPWLFEMLDKDIALKIRKHDGAKIAPGTILGEIKGPARHILAGERLSLNILQHLSGIASVTAEYVGAVKGTKAKILDTRKTLPGLRILEKYAVACGGGQNHRMGLYDAVMIKDNHIDISSKYGYNIKGLVEKARREVGKKIEITVEARTLEHVNTILETDADVILLDNMSPATMRRAVKLAKGSGRKRLPKFEASGGITLRNVRRAAETGVDRISIGALTHSVVALDIALKAKK